MQIKKLISNPLISGTAILTLAGISTRIMGFVFRIFLSKTIGEEGMGIYQLTFPVLGICLSVSALSIQTALSRMIAEKKHQMPGQEGRILRTALFLSLSLALVCIAVIYPFSDLICLNLLKETRCSSLLRMLILSLPFSCIHTCLCGCYFGQNQTSAPAFSQFIEQLTRIGSIFLIWYIRTQQNAVMSLNDIAAGAIISEMATALYLILSYSSKPPKNTAQILPSHLIMSELIKTAMPLCANRLSMTLLQALESILIPIQLKQYGLSTSQALSVFGVFTGMAIPFIMFPATITHSAAVLLLPKIASDTASGNLVKVKKAASANLFVCLLLGAFCLVFFLITGPFLGQSFFHSSLAGYYIRTLAWTSPFIYLGITCGSILNGLGKLSTVFTHNILSLLIRLAAVFILIPRFGINGYLTGMLTSQIILCILHLYSIQKTLRKNQSSTSSPSFT